ncbi:response regulator [Vibrio hippocampi]|uniref:Hydrogenase transcriptional regulatory protein hupR1 n=1 Tax=Vibrio hippocampi TaxID=654686 RepID=A0ABN8DF77_9VIBR|nr:response regulator [Vibrio hippocampi]CAH0525806.1 Hydrogenase transcriptional regulatory protein hupR1 [Vibrio hippocampi]
MPSYLIICIDDERVVLDSVVDDLAELDSYFIIEAAESAEEARQVIEEKTSQEVQLALVVCDQIMPQQHGVDFLIELHDNPKYQASKKILLTGQASHQDTIEAVNHACLDYYISKPWDQSELYQVVRQQLTNYMIETHADLAPWTQILDTEAILNAMAKQRIEFGDG